MYKVMIVDDETIILSGIKFLLDWEAHDCVISQTARNGKDALEQIRQSPPDIVLADINMPVMDGIELLRRVDEAFPHIVFIMLTNLEEFELARKALVYRAVDYLLKSRLETETLERALEAAKKERDKRTQLMVVNSQDYFAKKEEETLINRSLQALLFMSGMQEESGQAEEVLMNYGMLDAYAYLHILFDYSTLPDAENMGVKERRELLEWMRELTGKTADTVFRKNYVILDTAQTDALVLFVYHLNEGWERSRLVFQKKLTSTVGMITQAGCTVLATACFQGRAELSACRREYQALLDGYYLTGKPGEMLKEERLEALGLSGIGGSLQREIHRRNLAGVQAILDKAASRVRGVVHQKSQAIWLLNELNRSASLALGELGCRTGGTAGRISSSAEIDSIKTRTQVLDWIDMLEKMLRDTLESVSGQGNQIAERARRYVLEHLEEHVSLQDAADHVGVSVGYLSTVFKRTHSQSFIDFANQAKIEYACKLLEDNQLMIAEIAYKLGFENAYYFSKVFRKYMGMTPTDYQKKGR